MKLTKAPFTLDSEARWEEDKEEDEKKKENEEGENKTEKGKERIEWGKASNKNQF